MRKKKLFLLMACMVMAMSACQGKDAKQKTESTPAVEENTEEKDTAEMREKEEANEGSQYEGLTLEELEDLGFGIEGNGYSSVMGSDYSITLSASKNNYLWINFKIGIIFILI